MVASRFSMAVLTTLILATPTRSDEPKSDEADTEKPALHEVVA